MPKILAYDLPARVQAEIARHTTGITRTLLAQAFSKEVSPRSLARILGKLSGEKRIAVDGRGRATRYLPSSLNKALASHLTYAPASLAATVLRADAESYVPLTGESEALRSLIKRPIMQRHPVGYDRSLLDNYRPNETFYLSDAGQRERLHEIGQPPFDRRPAGTYARDIYNRLLIDLSWASSRLEGNTYTQIDTANLIEHNHVAEGRDRMETRMILNHKQAIEFLIEGKENIGFNMHTFMNLHAMLAEDLLDNPAAAGRLRTEIVEISRTVYRPLANPPLLGELFRTILSKAAAILDPFEQAFFLMVHIPYLQPFIDVNKRVSRLAANIPFIRHNLCPLSFVDVPERAYVDGTLVIYEHGRVDLLRDVFIWAYERSAARYVAVRQSLGEPDPFRLQHRAALRNIVGEVIRARMDRKAAAAHVAKWTQENVAPADRDRFREIAESELLGLHEGNYARYEIRPAEFAGWQQVWKET